MTTPFVFIGFVVFFLIIALTIILGAISKGSDKRVAREGRATTHQRLPGETAREVHV